VFLLDTNARIRILNGTSPQLGDGAGSRPHAGYTQHRRVRAAWFGQFRHQSQGLPEPVTHTFRSSLVQQALAM